jgi:hypothetical protein
MTMQAIMARHLRPAQTEEPALAGRDIAQAGELV